MIVFFHFIFSFTKYLWHTVVHREVVQDLKVLFETNSKTEAFEKYENRRLNLESLGIGYNSHDHNLKWTTEDGDFFRNSDFKLDFEPAFYTDDNIRFHPPVFQQRYLTVAHVISNPKWKGKIRKVVEFGCAEIALLNYLKLIQGITEINVVDIDGQLLRDNVYRVQPWFCESYNFQRAVPLTVNVLRGSVSHPDRHCKGVDAVIAIELIEHMYEDELSQLPQNIFGCIKPRVAIFTTPNSDFNVLFINFSGFRHHDHKFEWSRKEFESWANNICVQYPEYEVHFIGIGPPPIGKEDLGYCSQGAVFMRLQNDGDNQNDCEELNTDSYELIETSKFPVAEKLDPEIKTLTDAGCYIRVCERLGEYQKDYKTVIPLPSILIRVYKTCKSTDKLRQILEKKYKIEENSDGEEVLVYSGESDDESDSGLDENCLTNGVQDNDDDNQCNNQWEQESCSSWGSVKKETDTGDNLDKNQWGEEHCDLSWNCEDTEPSKTLETVTKDNIDNHQWGEDNSNCGEIDQENTSLVSPGNSASDASCGNLDDLKEILTNLPSLQPYCESDFIYDPAQQSESILILEDARSIGLETIVSVSDENYESSNVSSNSQIRTSDSSFVMDDIQSFHEPGCLTEGHPFDCGADLTKSKSLQSIGEEYVSGKSGHDVKGTKSLESMKLKHENYFEKCGDDLKNWKSLHCVSEKQKRATGKCYSAESRTTLDCIGSELKTVKVLPISLEQHKDIGEKYGEFSTKLDGFVHDELKISRKSSSERTFLPDEGGKVSTPYISDNVVENTETPQLNSSKSPNVSNDYQKHELYSGEQLENEETSQTTSQPKEKCQDGSKRPDPISVNLDSQEFCYREEKSSSDLGEEQLSDFDSISSLNPQWSDRTMILQDSNLDTEDDISENNPKLPKSVQDSSSAVGLTEKLDIEEKLFEVDKMGTCELSCFEVSSQQPFETKVSCNNGHEGCKYLENISDIEFEDIASRPSKSKDSDLSYKSCDTSIREEENLFRGDSVGNTCLPDLEGLTLSNKQSSSSLDESRRFSSTSFIFKSQSQEKIKEIFSFRSIGSDKFESDAKNSKMVVSEGKDCDSSPLHKCHSTGKISKDFSAYNEGVISNSCVDKFPSSLSSELEFFDKNNDLARERRCMSVSCIGNINFDYDENSCMEERELQNSCSPDKFGPDSGYPNSSSGLDMEMDTPEQVKEIMTESESSFDESPLESPVVEELPFENNLVVHPPVIPVGENVENGDVANNNRDGEGNNMVGPGIVGDALEFHALIEENEGNLQLMEAACNVEHVEEGGKNVDESIITTELVVNEVESADVERTCDEIEGSTEVGEIRGSGTEGRKTVESEELPCASNMEENEASTIDLPSSGSSSVNAEKNNNCNKKSSSFNSDRNPQSQIDLPSSSSPPVIPETNNNSGEKLLSSDQKQNLRSQTDQSSTSSSSGNNTSKQESCLFFNTDRNLQSQIGFLSTSSSPVNNTSDQGSGSSHAAQNLQSQFDLPASSCSSTTNNSADQGYSSSHSEQNLRSQVDLPSTSSSTTNNTSDPGSSSFNPEQNLWSPFDLPSTSSSSNPETSNTSDGGLDFEESNILQVDDLNSLVPLSLVEIVLNRLIREMAEDALIDNALDFFIAEEGIQMLDVNAVIEQDPTDFMGGGDSAAENM